MRSRALLAFFVAFCACAKSYGDAGDAPTVDGPPTVVDPDLVISQTSQDIVDLGMAACNSSSATRTITVKNVSTVTKTYTLVLPGEPFVITDDHRGELPPGETASITIAAAPSRAGVQMAALVLQTSTGFVPFTLRTTGTGASLDWSSTRTDLGDVNETAGGTTNVMLRNGGTIAAKVPAFLIQGSTDYAISPSAAIIDPDSTATFEVALAPGAEGGTIAVIKPMAAGLCGSTPELLITGTRVNRQLTASNGDFGKKNCNADPGTRDIVINNFSPTAMSWTVDPVTKFAITAGASGNINGQPAGNPGQSKTGTITVTPATTPTVPGDLDESLVVHVKEQLTGANEKMLTVDLHVDVRGAVISFSVTDLAFHAVTGQMQKKSFTVKNDGNDAAYLGWTFTRTQGGPAWIAPAAISLEPGTPGTATMTYQPSTAPPNQGTLTATAQVAFGVLCNTPPVIHVTGAF